MESISLIDLVGLNAELLGATRRRLLRTMVPNLAYPVVLEGARRNLDVTLRASSLWVTCQRGLRGRVAHQYPQHLLRYVK